MRSPAAGASSVDVLRNRLRDRHRAVAREVALDADQQPIGALDEQRVASQALVLEADVFISLVGEAVRAGDEVRRVGADAQPLQLRSLAERLLDERADAAGELLHEHRGADRRRARVARALAVDERDAPAADVDRIGPPEPGRLGKPQERRPAAGLLERDGRAESKARAERAGTRRRRARLAPLDLHALEPEPL